MKERFLKHRSWMLHSKYALHRCDRPGLCVPLEADFVGLLEARPLSSDIVAKVENRTI